MTSLNKRKVDILNKALHVVEENIKNLRSRKESADDDITTERMEINLLERNISFSTTAQKDENLEPRNCSLMEVLIQRMSRAVDEKHNTILNKEETIELLKYELEIHPPGN